IGTMVQTRGGFWGQLALPDPSRLFSGGKIGRIFTRQFLTDTGFSLIKMAAVAWVVWSSLSDTFMTLPKLLLAPTEAQIAGIFAPLPHAAVRVVAFLTVLAGIDFAIQKYRFSENMKMTKEEVRRENKEEDGDPRVKARRRRKQRELAKNRAS